MKMNEKQAKEAIDNAVNGVVNASNNGPSNVDQLVEMSLRASRSMVAVIDAMCQRGAIKGEEMFAIGQLREQAVQVTQLAETVQSEMASE
jgi:hypothetical protein